MGNIKGKDHDILDALAGAFDYLFWNAEDAEFSCSDRKYALRIGNSLFDVYSNAALALTYPEKKEYVEKALKTVNSKREFVRNHSDFWADFLELVEKHLEKLVRDGG